VERLRRTKNNLRRVTNLEDVRILFLLNKYCHLLGVYTWRIFTCFGSDDWIYWRLFFQSFLITTNTALLLIYILSISLLNTHYDSESSLVVSWERNENSLTVNKSSNHTLCLHRLTSNSSSTTTFSWLSPTETELEFWTASFEISLSCNHFSGTQRTENALPLLLPACLFGLRRDRYVSSPLACWLLPRTDHVENTAPIAEYCCVA
jgi:hypothetical protein